MGKESFIRNKEKNSLKRKWKKIQFMAVFLTMMLFLSGCGSKLENVKIVFTTGFQKDEVFRIEEVSCVQPEIMVYITNIQNRYETVYGDEIWNTRIDGITLEDNIKETALAKIAQIKAMTLLAKKHHVVLDEEEEQLVKEAAGEYFSSLNNTEKDVLNVNLDLIENLYREYALADKVYHYLIKDINPEISDDEARTITVEHILVKTYNLNQAGEKIEYTKYAKKQAELIALNILRKAKEGEDFEALAAKYSDDDTLTYSFGKGEKTPAFEEAAFNLGTDEISDLVETQFGYHIIKCVNTFNREVTEQNKKKIMEERKKEVFGEEYEKFVSSLTKHLNEELWNNIRFVHNKDVSTDNFFDIYDTYFQQ